MDLTPYGIESIITPVNWTVLFHDDFDGEFASLTEDLQDELLAHAKLLAQFPNRPPVVIEHLGVQHPVVRSKSSPRRARAAA